MSDIQKNQTEGASQDQKPVASKQEKKGKKRKRKKKHRGLWIFLKIQLVLLFLIIAAIGVYFGSGIGGKVEAMRKKAIEQVENSTEETFRASQTSLVYDANGDVLQRLKGEKDVYYLESDLIPQEVKDAFISIEDKKFYDHNGIDLKAIFRAAKSLLVKQEVTQGGSTITQQLSRNVFLSMEVTWQRKAAEIFTALEIEKKYTKSQILEFYINNINFANGYYGIQAASKGYFGVEADQLSLSQIAFLCAVPNNPTTYNPRTKLENTVKRRDRILTQMYDDGKITATALGEAKAEQITVLTPERTKNDYVETFIYHSATRALMEIKGFEFVNKFTNDTQKQQYKEAYSALYDECQKSLYTNGYRIYTTMNLGMQEQLQQAVDTKLSDFEKQTDEGIYTMQGAATCIDNQTGYVVAIVGGRSQESSNYTLNRGYQSYRQPGSSIKPLVVYAPAMDKLGYTPSTMVDDTAIKDDKDAPKDSRYEGKIQLRYAIEKSKNGIAYKTFKELTPEVGINYLLNMDFGKIDKKDYYPSTALGGMTYGASTVEMAAGFATLENDGKYREPTCITKIENADGEVIYEDKREETKIYEQNTARMMTDILKGVISQPYGTGKNVKFDGMSIAGKTGTTNDNTDGWFVGYSPYYTTSVWVGCDQPKAVDSLKGSTYPGGIWKQFMSEIHKGLDDIAFPEYVKSKKEKDSDYEWKMKNSTQDKNEENAEKNNEKEPPTEENGEVVPPQNQTGNETPDNNTNQNNNTKPETPATKPDTPATKPETPETPPTTPETPPTTPETPPTTPETPATPEQPVNPPAV